MRGGEGIEKTPCWGAFRNQIMGPFGNVQGGGSLRPEAEKALSSKGSVSLTFTWGKLLREDTKTEDTASFGGRAAGP